MANSIYFNAPCELYKGFLSDNKVEYCLHNVINFVIYAQSSKNGYNKDNCGEYASEHLCVNCSNPASNYTKGRKLFYELVFPNNTAPAYFSISKDMYWHFRNEESTFDERVSALAYLAIKSMIGKREYIKTNMTLLCSRMDGYTRYRGQELSPELSKYTNRYWSHKLMNDLYQKYGVIFYCGNAAHKVRGFYCSITLSMADLIRKAENARAEARARPDPLREAQRKALEEIEMQANNSP